MNKIEQSFWQGVEKTEKCWYWKKGLTSTGYGQFKSGKTILAHRYSWELACGPIPQNMCVLHRCDIRNCVNPSHLWLGTQADNMQDKAIKGRCNSPKEEKHNHCKLTIEQIKEIRQSKENNHKLGRKYSVSPCAIWKIKHRITWRSVE